MEGFSWARDRPPLFVLLNLFVYCKGCKSYCDLLINLKILYTWFVVASFVLYSVTCIVNCDRLILQPMNTWYVASIFALCVFWKLFMYSYIWIDESYDLNTLASLFALYLFVFCDLLIDGSCEHLVHCLHCCFLCIVTSDRWQKQHRRRSLPYWSPSHKSCNLTNL